MKIKELIEALSKHDPEMEVMQHGYEGGFGNVSGVMEVEMALNVYNEWYYGHHESIDASNKEQYEGKEKIQAIIIL